MTSITEDYFVAVKAYYENGSADVADYGKVIIEVVVYEEDKVTEITGINLFQELAGVT